MVKEKSPKEKVVKKSESSEKSAATSETDSHSKPEVDSPKTIIKEKIIEVPIIKEIFVEKPKQKRKSRTTKNILAEEPKKVELEIPKSRSTLKTIGIIVGFTAIAVILYLGYLNLTKKDSSSEEKLLKEIREGKITGLSNVKRIG